MFRMVRWKRQTRAVKILLAAALIAILVGFIARLVSVYSPASWLDGVVAISSAMAILLALGSQVYVGISRVQSSSRVWVRITMSILGALVALGLVLAFLLIAAFGIGEIVAG